MKPSLPQGTRDFAPDTVRKRTFILDTIRHVFELYGYQPLETPAMENLETLIGKYGEEGDRLIFKILNNGLDHVSKKDQARNDFEKLLEGKNVKGITERALRYDLTIPFARYVAMNHRELAFPFKRYQIQPVWRADRPQKGRYREFFQCDADVVGSDSLLNEVELAQIYIEVFARLGLVHYELRLNHRRILTALAELCGGPQLMNTIAAAIDKLEKQGPEKVKAELQQKGLNREQLRLVDDYLGISGSNDEKLTALKDLFSESDAGNRGVDELDYVLRSIALASVGNPTATGPVVDPTLARGLDYYTGIIFEAKPPPTVQLGSIGGGGRYDDLTGLFGVPGIPGVGISFGVDRIYDAMEELKLFPESLHISTQVLFFNLGEAESRAAFGLMQELRSADIRCELFHENAKFEKQFRYAEKKNIPYVVIIGEKELSAGEAQVKDLRNGTQVGVGFDELRKVVADRFISGLVH
ncbi:MAG TPA: histidine--tRNA ligase [Chitinophagaceae bacterium]|nr:histidine--tRNA ligase [Chitinophagaceae bacterium]